MNKKAFFLACFNVTQELARTGQISENKSCQHALDRGDALAKLALALASEYRIRARAWGSPQQKAAYTRIDKASAALGASLNEPARLSFPNQSNWPDVVLRDMQKDVTYFRLPNPNDF